MGKLTKGKGILGVLLTAMMVCALLAPSAVAADNPSPFATEVVSSDGPFGPSPYDDPNALLGKPTTRFKDQWNPPTERVKLVEPAYNVGISDEKLITTLNYDAGPPEDKSEIVVKFDHQVMDDPDNPYGIDLLVFGNPFFTGSGFVNDYTNMNDYMLTGGGFFENVKVSVSQDGVNWYRYDDGPYGDNMFPTQAYLWDRENAQWTETEMDWTKSVNPALTLADFNGISAADAIDLYDGSAGGTGFDLAESGYEWIQYVRVQGISGFAGGEIDAFADVAPICSDVTIDLRATGAGPNEIIDVTNYTVSAGTVTEDGITVDKQTAMGALICYCQDYSINIEVTEGSWGPYVVQIGGNSADENCWMYAVNEVTPGAGAAAYALSSGDNVHWFNYTLGLYSLSLSLDKTSIVPGEDITFSVTWTDGNGTMTDVENAEVLVSAILYDPGVSQGYTNSGGDLTVTWNDEGTYYPYAEIDTRTSMYQWPTPEFTCAGAYPNWDVNEDGVIDTQDIVRVGMHWGETGTPGWIREDVNSDGKVDTQDIVIIGMHWGE